MGEFGKEDYQQAWYEWDDMKTYGPASRHVRRLIFMFLKGIKFDSVLDVGCGVGTLLAEIRAKYPQARLAGSEYVNSGLEAARKRLPDGTFEMLDLSQGHLPGKHDLVLCVDVLEHIQDDQVAMRNLAAMTGAYLLVIVPLGPLFEVERLRVGHVHGYSRAEFDGKLTRSGLKIIRSLRWGFPVYNLYRRLLHRVPEKATTGKYGLGKRTVSALLYLLFFLSLPFGGERYFVLCAPA